MHAWRNMAAGIAVSTQAESVSALVRHVYDYFIRPYLLAHPNVAAPTAPRVGATTPGANHAVSLFCLSVF